MSNRLQPTAAKDLDPADGGLAASPLERGPVPLHHQLYLELRGALERGVWTVGEMVPTERALADLYGCSIITVRRALDELRRERRIERRAGVGTFVCAPPIARDLTALTSFSEEMTARGLEPETQVLAVREERAPAAVAEALDVAPGAPIAYVERLRIAGGEPLLLEEVRLPAERLPRLTLAELERGSLYDLLERHAAGPVRAEERIEPVLPGARAARLLGQSPRRPALRIDLVAFTGDDVPIEHCKAIVRGDRATYHVKTNNMERRTP